MDISPEMKEFFRAGYKEYLPHVAIDSTIFGYHEQQLKILLIKHRLLQGWSLPGGFIKRTEKLIDAANRIVKERTGIDNLYLQQFKTFGDPYRSRYDQSKAKHFFKQTMAMVEKDSWLLDHFISIGFYAITDFSRTVPKTDFMSAECAWFDIDNHPKLELDHDQMVVEALHTMRMQLHYYPIGYSLLPHKFTLAEIHALYQSLLGKKLDVSNFSKKLLALGLLKKLNEKRGIGPHRSPNLYSFDKRKYDMALKQGLDLS
ncbi:MAG: NUDIX domain-containing protein [Bacteroidota bacterium]